MYTEGLRNSDNHPDYIYYCASEEDVRKFQSKSDSLALASKAAHQKTRDKIINSISTVKQDIADLKEHFTNTRSADDSKQAITAHGAPAGHPGGRDEPRQEIDEHRGLESPRSHREVRNRDDGELKRELEKLRELVQQRPPGHEELKQELAELREIVQQHPPGQDELRQELTALRGLVASLVLQLGSNNTTA